MRSPLRRQKALWAPRGPSRGQAGHPLVRGGHQSEKTYRGVGRGSRPDPAAEGSVFQAELGEEGGPPFGEVRASGRIQEEVHLDLGAAGEVHFEVGLGPEDAAEDGVVRPHQVKGRGEGVEAMLRH